MKIFQEFRAYFSVFRLRFQVETQYRAAAAGGIICQIFFGLINIALYHALYRFGAQNLPLQRVVTYVWIQQAFFRMLLSSDGELTQNIRTGGMAYELCRPLSPYGFYYARAMAQKMVGAGLRAGPMLLFAALMPGQWGIQAPAGVWQFFMSVLSLGGGLLCVCALDNIGVAFTIRSLDNSGIQALLSLLMMTFSGNILPLTLFPDSWQPFLRFSPYSQILDGPIRIYTGECAFPEACEILLIQMVWAAILALLGILMWRSNQKRMIVQGG